MIFLVMKKIVFTGGGTAGHIYPNLAIAEQLKNWEIHYIGSHGMEKEIVARYPFITFHEIDCVKFDRTSLLKNLAVPIKLSASIRQAKKMLKAIKPNIIFSKGGFVSLPVARAAKKLHVPLITHESDLSLGLANKIISKSAKVVCTTFFETSLNKPNFIYTGQPIRQGMFNGDRTKVLAKLHYPNKPIILFVGGSLGSVRINELLTNPEYLTKNYCIIHSVGKNNISKFKQKNNYFPFAYLDPISDFYAAADLVVTRAGSGVINELAALQKPMLMLPLSKAASRGDQIENAKLFSKLGYGEMIIDENLNEQSLQKIIDKMMTNLNFYKKNMQKSQKQQVNDKIIKLIEKFS